MTEHQPLPVHGYKPQDDDAVAMVNHHKRVEEEILRILDNLAEMKPIDKRWLTIGRTHIELGFMAINRSVFKPTRVSPVTGVLAATEAADSVGR